jgi:hypothetical protein
LATVAALLVLDIIFFLFVSGGWLTLNPDASLWNSLIGMHRFALFTSAIVFFLKVNTILFRFLYYTLFGAIENWE